MTDSIFDDTGSTPAQIIEQPKPPTVPDSLKELIGEGKKYASVDKALEALPHAQEHISKIERENAEMREKLAEAIAVEEVYKKLTESFNRPDGVTPPAAGLDEASIDALLERKLAEKDALTIANANTQRVKDALIAKFGEKAQEVYETKAKELGVSVQFLNDVVKKSPKAAEELFGIKGKEAAPASSTPGINTATLNTNRHPQQPSAKVQGSSTEALVAAWRAAKPE